MPDREIACASLATLEAVTAFNLPVFQSHAEITAILRTHLGMSAAAIFARPQPHGTEIGWTTDLPGTVRCWSRLNVDERNALEPARRAFAEQLSGLVARLRRAGANTTSGNMSHLLESALIVPGPEHLHVVGDRFVLSFWGFRRRGKAGLAPFGESPPVIDMPAPRRQNAAWLPLCLLSILLFAPALLHREAPLPPPVAKPAKAAPEEPIVPATPPPMVPPAPPAVAVVNPVPFNPAPMKPKPDVMKPKPKPPDNVLRMPVNGDLSALEGCWRTDRYSYATSGSLEFSTYCFDAHGNGHMVHEGGGAPCDAPADIELHGDGAMYLADRNSLCRDGAMWHQDRLLCRGAPGGPAVCQGQSNDADGAPIHWSTTLRRH